MTDWQKVDLHIHSALSPCADDLMTPHNIVNMAKLLGLAVISVTDHQAADNVATVSRLAAQEDIVCLPGIELQSREEVHLLAYFPDIITLRQFSGRIKAHLLDQRRNSPYFGKQLIFDLNGQVAGESPVLLCQSVAFTLEQLCLQVTQLGGCCVPAHLDRPAFSLYSQLGFMPEGLPIATVEYSQRHFAKPKIMASGELLAITSSDAHSLGEMVTKGNTWLHHTLRDPHTICQALREGDQRLVRTYISNL